jgi:hypothetical protein
MVRGDDRGEPTRIARSAPAASSTASASFTQWSIA